MNVRIMRTVVSEAEKTFKSALKMITLGLQVWAVRSTTLLQTTKTRSVRGMTRRNNLKQAMLYWLYTKDREASFPQKGHKSSSETKLIATGSEGCQNLQ